MIIQIYEVQDPAEAQALIDLGVDHIGSVIVSEEKWKIPLIKETIAAVQSAAGKSSLIPLFNNPDSVTRTLDYYGPDIVHFCEALADQKDIWGNCAHLIDLQENVKKKFPDIKIMRSIPIVQQGEQGSVATLEFGRRFEPVSDFFLTDTLLVKNDASQLNPQPVEGFVGITDQTRDWGDIAGKLVQESITQPGAQPVEGFVGITGQTCDWQVARYLVQASRIPVILAGGISPQNVIDAIRNVRPAGVDSCTQTNMVDQNGDLMRFKKDLKKVKFLVEAVRKIERRFD